MFSEPNSNGPKADPSRYEPALASMPPRLIALKKEIVFGEVDPDSDEVSIAISGFACGLCF